MIAYVELGNCGCGFLVAEGCGVGALREREELVEWGARK